MLKNYFLLAWRNLIKYKSSAFINIGGLTLGVTTSLLVLFFLVDEFSYDKFHANISQLYLLLKNQRESDGISTGRSSAGPIGPTLAKEFPEVVRAVRLTGTGTMATIGDRRIKMNGLFADTGFFNMMSFPSLEGDPGRALNDPHSILLTASAARRLFGGEPALGKAFVVDDTVPVRVAAILRDAPTASTIHFDYIRPFSFFEVGNTWLKKWDDNRIQTWVQFQPGTDIAAFDRKATALLQSRSNDTTVSTFAMPMARLRLYAGFENGKPSGGKIYLVMLMVVLGFFVLAIACINFMNLATARSEIRAKEVGVRKVMGASRRQIMLQFFCEAITLSAISLVFGLLTARAATPLFNRYLNTNIHPDFSSLRLLAGIVGVGLLTGLLAGSYPALFLSRFSPARVLKGGVAVGKKKSWLRRGLVTTQFCLAVIFIIGTLVVWQQIKYVQDRPVGYDQENLIDVRASAMLGANYSLFVNKLHSLAGVKHISVGGDNLLNYGSGITGMDWPGKIPGQEVSILVTTVGYDWISTTGLKLAQGRDFDPAFGNDSAACMVNESLVKRLGLKEPLLGQKVGGSPIIGVVKDFVFNNPSGVIAPMAIYLYKGNPGEGHIFVRVANDGHWRQTVASIGAIAKELDPAHQFDYSFTKEDYQQRFEEFASFGMLATIFGGMAIFISCLGLIGLAAFLTERRSREMSIRKVFGASRAQVLILLSSDFLKPVLMAFIVAAPLAALGLNAWLGTITYHVTLSWTVFASGGMLTFLIAIATVGLQGLRTASENPAVNLRNE